MSSEAKAYAVIKTGGKQYRVEENKKYRFEKIEGVEAGSVVAFDEVLMHSDGDNVSIGEPKLDNVKVTGEVVHMGRLKKVKILKFKRRKHHMKRQGHRQSYTEVKITQIAK